MSLQRKNHPVTKAIRLAVRYFIIPAIVAVLAYLILSLALAKGSGGTERRDMFSLVLKSTLMVIDIFWVVAALGVVLNLSHRLIFGHWYEGTRSSWIFMLEGFRDYPIASPGILRRIEPLLPVKQPIVPVVVIFIATLIYVLISTPVTVATRWLEELWLESPPSAISMMWVEYAFRNLLIAVALAVVTLLIGIYMRYAANKNP